MQSVLDHLGQLSQKEIQQKLDQDIVDSIHALQFHIQL